MEMKGKKEAPAPRYEEKAKHYFLNHKEGEVVDHKSLVEQVRNLTISVERLLEENRTLRKRVQNIERRQKGHNSKAEQSRDGNRSKSVRFESSDSSRSRKTLPPKKGKAPTRRHETVGKQSVSASQSQKKKTSTRLRVWKLLPENEKRQMRDLEKKAYKRFRQKSGIR